MTKKAPYMPLYGKDAWSSERFSLLSWEAQGLFWRLAYWQWDEGSIPADISVIVNVVGIKTTRRAWREVEPFFPEVGGGRRANPTLAEHRDRLASERDRKRRGWEAMNESLSAAGIPLAEEAPPAAGNPPATRIGVVNANALTDSQKTVQLVLDALRPDLRPAPGLVAKWIKQLGSAEAVREVVWKYPDKPAAYLTQVIASEASNATRRNDSTGTRPTPTTPRRTAKEFGHETADEYLARTRAEGKLPEVPKASS